MELYYKESGNPDAPMIVFLHGGGVSGWMWNRQVEFFSNYHVLVPDIESHGKSHSEHFVSIEESAGKIIRLIESKSGGKKVTIVGLSLGAQILVEILSEAPEIAECAIINSALVRPMKWTKKMIKPMFRMSYGLIKNRKFARLQAAQLYISDEDFEIYFAESKNTLLEDLIQVLESNMSYSLPPEFKNAKVKIMVLVGAKEKGVMLKSAHDMLQSNKYCTGYSVPGIGHGVSLADPELFNQLTRGWIENKELPTGLTAIS